MKETQRSTTTQILIKKCHRCGHIIESEKEVERCTKCKKSFLPSGYFSKVHVKNSREYRHLFSHVTEINEDDLIKGIYVIW